MGDEAMTLKKEDAAVEDDDDDRTGPAATSKGRRMVT